LKSTNIVNDPLPEAAFDLVHTRLVLVHLPERDRVLERLIAALKPGGWIAADELDACSAPCYWKVRRQREMEV